MCDECERAFKILEAYGVPRERARTVGNGIQVLVTRMDREMTAMARQFSQEVTAKGQQMVESFLHITGYQPDAIEVRTSLDGQYAEGGESSQERYWPIPEEE